MPDAAKAKAQAQAEIHYGKQGGIPTVEVVVPQGTTFAQVAALHEVISRQAIAKVSPRGCQQCTSGSHILIRERLDEVIHVDLPAVGKLGE